jgi:hypothetical protein
MKTTQADNIESQNAKGTPREAYEFLMEGHTAMILAYGLVEAMAPEWDLKRYDWSTMPLDELIAREAVINAKLFSLLDSKIFSYEKHHE